MLLPKQRTTLDQLPTLEARYPSPYHPHPQGTTMEDLEGSIGTMMMRSTLRMMAGMMKMKATNKKKRILLMKSTMIREMVWDDVEVVVEVLGVI